MSAKGYYTGVYTSTSWLGTFVETTYPIWIANWGTNDGNINSDHSDIAVIHQYTSNPFDKDVVYHDIEFFKSDPKRDEPKKDENGSNSEKDESKNDKSDGNSSDSVKKDEINVSGINKLIELLLKIVEKIANLFK